ncbi:MAG TPA: tyrosine-type recombinase/integrase, partial [Bacteroidia bacterium]|nr:tyrosine-type recombinase/integrase [Bacteroidia bacterium]
MYANLKVNNGSVVVNYSMNGRMRFPTQVTISKEKASNGKFKEWDYKNNLVRNTVENYAATNKVLSKILKVANDIITEHLNTDIKITAKELEALLANTRKEKQETHSALLLDRYDDFMERMEKKLKQSPDSFKTYKTFKNTLLDYEFDLQKQFKATDIINYDWCVDFTAWLQEKRPNKATKNGITHTYKSRGQAAVNTIDKRYEVLKGFAAYLKEIKVISDYTILLRYTKESVRKKNSIKTTLTIDELYSLLDFQLEKRLSQVRDLFVIACFTGLRWKDLVNFNKELIINIDGKPVYQKIPNKTKNTSGITVTIPLADIVIKYLEKLNYNLDIISNQKANVYLKQALQKTELFNDLTNKKDKLDRNLRRFEIMSFHKGRDTFITNLIDSVPLSEIMKYTGHTKLSNLQKYIDM